MAIIGGAPQVIGCTFSNCVSATTGGAVDCQGGAPEFTDCRFSGSQAAQGGAVNCAAAAAPILTSCYFENDVADLGAGLVCSQSEPRLVDCTFAGESASAGGAFVSLSSEPSFSGCTFALNSAGEGAAIVASQSTVTLENAIIAFSPEGQAIYSESSDWEISCCDIFGNSGGDWVGPIAGYYGQSGNISLDPLFCSVPERIWNLREDSPCAPFSPQNPECDLVGAWPAGCPPSDIPDQQESEPGTFARIALASPRPAPSIGPVTLAYSLPPMPSAREGGTNSLAGDARLEIFDPAGRLVRAWSLVGESAGGHTRIWDRRDQQGARAATGVYLVRLTSDDQVSQRSFVLIR